MKTIINNLKICSRWDKCSANICPMDPNAILIDKLPGEESCPFTIKKRGDDQKGIKTLAPTGLLAVIPESNVKMIHNANQKRWHALHILVTK